MSNFQEVVIKQDEAAFAAPVVLSETPRPENVPEEFWDAVTGTVNTEALLAAVPKSAPKATEGDPEEGTDAPKEGDEEVSKEEAAAAKLAAEAGVDVGAVEAQFLETGEIDAGVYEKMSAVGISKELVDEFVQFRVGQADRMKEEVLQPFGGEEAVGKMAVWAGTNWTEAQAEAFNVAISSGNRGQMELVIKGLKADYDKKNGVKPTLLQGNGNATTKGNAFGSLAEMMAAQRDPRYRTDPAYRDSVMERLKRSNI